MFHPVHREALKVTNNNTQSTIFSLIRLWISNTVVVTHSLTAVCNHNVDSLQNKRKGFIENL